MCGFGFVAPDFLIRFAYIETKWNLIQLHEILRAVIFYCVQSEIHLVNLSQSNRYLSDATRVLFHGDKICAHAANAINC